MKQTHKTSNVHHEDNLDNSPALQHLVRKALENYFSHLDGYAPSHLYELVLKEVEMPLLQTVLSYVNGNQCKAAKILGISRGTLRKKLFLYNLD